MIPSRSPQSPRALYDSTNVAGIPLTATLLAGYINGKYQSYYPMVAKFPTATVLSITVSCYAPNTSNFVAADILDVESGDATPAHAPLWTVAMRALGKSPTIYCSLDSWASVVSALVTARVALPYFWIADWTNTPHLIPGSVATQWVSTPGYDASITNGSWPLSTINNPPTVPPVLNPSIQVGDKMLTTVPVKTDANGNGYNPTTLPWSTFQAATLSGSDPDPTADDAYWPGYCKVQDRNGTILVSVIGCLPSTIQNVFVLTS